jgi:high-affinity iron transporter
MHSEGIHDVAHKKLVRQVSFSISALLRTYCRQVWFGVGLGLLLVIIIGAGLIGAFYGLTKDAFSGWEDVWEGVFALLASLIIGIMGAALLRINKMREKWRVRIIALLENKESTKSHPLGQRFKIWSEKNAMFLLPFITVLREGLECVVFIGGVGLSYPATAFPIPVITGLLAGLFVGLLIYKYAR